MSLNEIRLLRVVIAVVATALFVAVSVIFLVYLERKVAGHVQRRPGPFEVGPHGMLQTVADAVKLQLQYDLWKTKRSIDIGDLKRIEAALFHFSDNITFKINGRMGDILSLSTLRIQSLFSNIGRNCSKSFFMWRTIYHGGRFNEKGNGPGTAIRWE